MISAKLRHPSRELEAKRLLRDRSNWLIKGRDMTTSYIFVENLWARGAAFAAAHIAL